MKTMIAGLAFAFTIAATAAGAQPVAYPPNEAGVNMGHWHLNSKDVEVNKEFFVALGGRGIQRGDNEGVLFPGVVVFLTGGQGAPRGGTAGTGGEPVRFAVAHVEEKTATGKS